MEMTIDFPGETRVDAHFLGFTIATDQPPAATAPTPFMLFIASIGTCAGIYALNFCQARSLDTVGLRIIQRIEKGADGHVERIELDVRLPASFPEKYRAPLLRAIDQCTVKRHLARPPRIDVTTTMGDATMGGVEDKPPLFAMP